MASMTARIEVSLYAAQVSLPDGRVLRDAKRRLVVARDEVVVIGVDPADPKGVIVEARLARDGGETERAGKNWTFSTVDGPVTARQANCGCGSPLKKIRVGDYLSAP